MSKIKAGMEKTIMGMHWKVLDVFEEGVLCLAEKLSENMQFDTDCNNWQLSNLRNYLNTKFYDNLAEEVGIENIVEFKRDLLSMDGQTEYGTCEDKVSLLTVDEYRKYRKFIPNADYWWWLITPDSTKCNNDTEWVRVVSPAGRFYYNGCNDRRGVRPVCIFSSAIFESESE